MPSSVFIFSSEALAPAERNVYSPASLLSVAPLGATCSPPKHCAPDGALLVLGLHPINISLLRSEELAAEPS